MKKFNNFLIDTCYVVELRSTGFCKAFYYKKDAVEYWELMEKKSEEPKLHTIDVSCLQKYLSQDDINNFLKNLNGDKNE